jgi:hypothetical protein
MNERRNDLEIVMERAIACTIQLGSISSLRCQKSRMTRPGEDHACEAMFSRTMFERSVCQRPVFALSSFDAAAFATDGLAEPKLRSSEGWWSQTGSNRRPHACKARALPAELWPHFPRRRPSSPFGVVALAFAGATAQQPSFKKACRAEAARAAKAGGPGKT